MTLTDSSAAGRLRIELGSAEAAGAVEEASDGATGNCAARAAVGLQGLCRRPVWVHGKQDKSLQQFLQKFYSIVCWDRALSREHRQYKEGPAL